LNNTKRDIENHRNSLSEQIGHKDNEINGLKSHVENISNQHRDLENHKNWLNEQIGHKDNEINGLKSHAENISNQHRDLENHKNWLNEQIGHKDNEINGLKSQVENMSNYQRDLERGKQSSEDQLNELRGRVEELDRRSNELNQQLNEKNSTLSRVEAELEQAKSAVRDFEAANNELKSKSESLEKRLGEVERNNDNEQLQKLKSLMDENDLLKVQNVNLKLALQQTEQSIASLETVIVNRESSLESELHKIGTNGSTNGNGVNGKYENGNGNNEVPSKESLDRLKKENSLLRKLLDDERRLNKETQKEKDKIKDLLKIGHEALEHERIEFQERLEEKQLQKEHEKTNGNSNGNGNHSVAVDINDQQSAQYQSF